MGTLPTLHHVVGSANKSMSSLLSKAGVGAAIRFNLCLRYLNANNVGRRGI